LPAINLLREFSPVPFSCDPILHFVILSEVRRSAATERESKDLCTLAFQRCHQGILTVPSSSNFWAARFPGTDAARTTVEERRFSAAFSVLTNMGL
jgi:hypothetical protein